MARCLGGAFLAVLVLAGCEGPTLGPPLAVPETSTPVASLAAFMAADAASFRTVQFPYPLRFNNPARIFPVGDYLLWRLAVTLPADAGITLLRLEGWRAQCAERGQLPPHLWCVTDGTVMISADGVAHRLTVSETTDVGVRIVPTDLAAHRQELAMHGQVRHAVDRFAVAVAEALRRERR